MLLLDVVTTVSVGLLIGVEFAVSVFINPVIERLDEGARATAIRLFGNRLGRAMPFWYSACLGLLIAEAIVRRHQAGSAWLVFAVVIWILVILATVIFLVPINNRLVRSKGDHLAPNELLEHDRWDSRHRLRVVALGVAMVCFLVAT